MLGLGAGAREVGLVAAAFALVPLFLAIPLGRLSDRRGGTRLLVVGGVLQVVACVGLAVAETPVGLGVASAVLGLGHLGLALGAQDVVARESAYERHDHHFGLLTTAVSLGQLAGPLVSGLLLGDRTGHALAAGTTRALLVAAGIAAAATVCAALSERNGGHVRAASARHGSVRTIAATRGVPAGIFASVAALSAADVFTAYMPVLGDQRGIGPRAVGLLLAIRAGASIVARVGIGTLVDRFGRIRLLSASASAAAAALVGLTFTADLRVLALLSAAAGLGLGFGQPLSMTMVIRLVPEHARATALAVRLTGNRIGQVAAPAAAGVVAGSAGVGSVFWLLSGLLVASAVAVQRPGLAGPGPGNRASP